MNTFLKIFNYNITNTNIAYAISNMKDTYDIYLNGYVGYYKPIHKQIIFFKASIQNYGRGPEVVLGSCLSEESNCSSLEEAVELTRNYVNTLIEKENTNGKHKS